MQQIKAIETEYKGHLMRSRLEARWAVFFDALGINWLYEPQGFELPSGERYLPDFQLPDHDMWVEVKGSEELVRDDEAKLAEAAHNLEGNGLLMLGPIPDPYVGLPQHFVVVREEHCCKEMVLCLHVAWAEMLRHPAGVLEAGFPCTQLWDHRRESLPAVKGYGRWSATRTGWLNPGQIEEWPMHEPITGAYRAARSARFEHGHSGAAL